MTSETILSGIDPEITERMTSRRDSVRRALLGLGAMATAPLVLSSLATEAFGKGSQLPKEIRDVLNFALTLEYIEDGFYRTGLNQNNLIPQYARPLFENIGQDEAGHVEVLKSALGSHAVKKPQVDYTAGGKFNDVFSNAKTFMALSQAFEDLGVRAYKGQAGNLKSNGKILTVALQIHSVEARHAAHVRILRNQPPWIVSNSRGNLPEATQPIYEGEANFKQDGVDLLKLSRDLQRNDIPLDAFSAAFDEPLSKQEVLAIVKPFLKA